MLLRSGAFCKANNPPAVWSGIGRLEWLSLHRWGMAGVWPESGLKVQLKLKASATRRVYRSALVILDNYATRGGEAPSGSSTGWRFWKCLRITRQPAAAARCLRVCPLNKYPAE